MQTGQSDLDNAEDKAPDAVIEREQIIIIEHQEEETESTKCVELRKTCHSCTKPLRTKYNPLPQDATCCQRFRFALLCPVHGNMAKYIVFAMMFLVSWSVLLSITGDGGIVGGNFFSLCVLFFSCILGGYVVEFVRLPPLLGKQYLIT